MPVVEVRETICRDIEATWDRVCDVESYPEYMEPVLSVVKVGDAGSSNLVKWEVRLKGSILSWTERETRLDDRYRLEFVQVEGDLERFTGYWQLLSRGPQSTEAILVIDFEIGIPTLREMLDPVAERALRDNCRA